MSQPVCENSIIMRPHESPSTRTLALINALFHGLAPVAAMKKSWTNHPCRHTSYSTVVVANCQMLRQTRTRLLLIRVCGCGLFESGAVGQEGEIHDTGGSVSLFGDNGLLDVTGHLVALSAGVVVFAVE